jgi:small subunit ribosomal protein S17
MAEAQRKPLKVYKGIVTSVSGAKTVKVKMDYLVKHEKYNKLLKRSVVAHVHDDANAAKVGDWVEISKCRPISKTKNWRLVRVV